MQVSMLALFTKNSLACFTLPNFDMTNTQFESTLKDLRVKEEIVPLFDYTHNSFAKSELINLLETPLSSQEEILYRQNIIKGFIKNIAVCNTYSYSSIYLSEVYHFLSAEIISRNYSGVIDYRLSLSRIDRSKLKSRLTQFIILFHKIHSLLFKRLDVTYFPSIYRKEISTANSFLDELDLEKLYQEVKRNQFKVRQVIALLHKISHLQQKGSISLFWKCFFPMEAYLSISLAIEKNKYAIPTVGNTSEIKLEEFYHPVLTNPVVNDLFSSSNVILLNGANMSGKSTLLKAVSLCVYLAHVGVGIPAKDGDIPLFNNFAVNITKQDDIQNGYSHFMNEIKNLKQTALLAKDKIPCFAVFDELFSGTNVEDALEICKTTIKGLSQFDNSLFIISTHIQELKSIKYDNTNIYHIDCQLTDGVPKFTYLLKEGWADLKIGKILFEKEGLNDIFRALP